MSAGAGVWLCVLLSLALSAASPLPPAPPAARPWGDWVIVDDAEPGASVLLRRITPKSVFVAPSFNGCAEGYQQDSLGRCVKLVKVNQQAQWNFFLERLNSMYASSSTSKKPPKEAGPFHINLPIGAAEGSQEDSIVQKRDPPKVEEVTESSSTSSTTPQPITSTIISESTMQESTTLLTTEPTTVDVPEVTNTEKEITSTESTVTDSRRVLTTESSLEEVMLGDQPDSTTEESFLELQTPKKPSQLAEAPFVIIVTNPPTNPTRGDEETTTNPPVSSTTEEVTSENPATELTETTSTEKIPKTTEYDGSSETRDITSIRPEEVYSSLPFTERPKCDSSREDQDRDCEPSASEVFTDQRKASLVSLPPSLPILEPNTRVRFPSESFVPPRKTQTFIRFPGDVNSQDRPTYWYPTFELRQHPGVRGWPPPDPPSEPQYHQPLSWYDSNSWRRRFPQRD